MVGDRPPSLIDGRRPTARFFVDDEQSPLSEHDRASQVIVDRCWLMDDRPIDGDDGLSVVVVVR